MRTIGRTRGRAASERCHGDGVDVRAAAGPGRLTAVATPRILENGDVFGAPHVFTTQLPGQKASGTLPSRTGTAERRARHLRLRRVPERRPPCCSRRTSRLLSSRSEITFPTFFQRGRRPFLSFCGGNDIPSVHPIFFPL